jgi:hypothetical protein
MPTEVPDPPHRSHVETNAAIPTVEQNVLERARRAADNAVRSLFELATLLQFLSEAIERYRADTLRESRE